MFCQVNLLNFENPAEIMGLFQNPLKFLQQTSISESSARVPERSDLSLEHSATFTSRSKQKGGPTGKKLTQRHYCQNNHAIWAYLNEKLKTGTEEHPAGFMLLTSAAVS